MAIYHLSGKIIGRKSGKSAVSAAAYRAGCALRDERTGITFDYTKKRGVHSSEIIAPECAPAWMLDRAQVWSAVEMQEKHPRAQTAREFDIALPIELSTDEKIELARNFVKENFVAEGMLADLAFHDLDSENPHFHVMLSLRKVTSNGFGAKGREWNDKQKMNDWRESWAVAANHALACAGVDARIDHRSLADQEIDRVPTIHLGPVACALEAKGVATDRGNENRKIIAYNEEKKSFLEASERYAEALKDAQASETKETQPEALKSASERSESARHTKTQEEQKEEREALHKALCARVTEFRLNTISLVTSDLKKLKEAGFSTRVLKHLEKLKESERIAKAKEKACEEFEKKNDFSKLILRMMKKAPKPPLQRSIHYKERFESVREKEREALRLKDKKELKQAQNDLKQLEKEFPELRARRLEEREAWAINEDINNLSIEALKRIEQQNARTVENPAHSLSSESAPEAPKPRATKRRGMGMR